MIKRLEDLAQDSSAVKPHVIPQIALNNFVAEVVHFGISVRYRRSRFYLFFSICFLTYSLFWLIAYTRNSDRSEGRSFLQIIFPALCRLGCRYTVRHVDRR